MAARRPHPRRLTATAALALSALALTACGTGSAGGASSTSDSSDGSSGGAEAAAFPVTIEHAYGETTIEEEPTRVVAWDWSTQDVVLGLGVVPVAMPEYTYGGDAEGLLPWTADALDAAGATTPTLLTYGGTEGVPFEEIAAAEPDVILAVNSGVTKADYETLSQIAPTVVQPGDIFATSWQDQVDVVGTALGVPEEAEALLATTEEAITAQAEAFPQLQGVAFAYASGAVTDGNISLYQPSDVRVQLLTELGMVLAPSVTALAPANDSFSFPLSLERADELTSQVFVAWFGDQVAADAFAADPLVQRVPAIAGGGLAPIVGEPFVMATSAVSPLSIPWAMEDYAPILAAAVDASAA